MAEDHGRRAPRFGCHRPRLSKVGPLAAYPGCSTDVAGLPTEERLRHARPGERQRRQARRANDLWRLLAQRRSERRLRSPWSTCAGVAARLCVARALRFTTGSTRSAHCLTRLPTSGSTEDAACRTIATENCWTEAPSNKGMKQTSVERIGRSQLIPGVRRTGLDCRRRTATASTAWPTTAQTIPTSERTLAWAGRTEERPPASSGGSPGHAWPRGRPAKQPCRQPSRPVAAQRGLLLRFLAKTGSTEELPLLNGKLPWLTIAS